MSLATLTTKGQLTIPKKIRESLNLHSGDKIEIVITGNMEAVIRPVSKKVDDIFCKLHRSNRKPVTIEAMNNAIKNKLKDKFK
ncbi:MAG: AbrB/MazE/SpoVT family DNA-binding domain-containing protein [Pseudomonadota bacterium]|nr:AbrB/MazE/SpoVT family DNA-binding domain-containing protein [Pseudomonadota bacterium]